MEIRRQEDGETLMLTWDAVAAVTGWEVRFSERPDARGDYVVREEMTLPAAATSVKVPLGKHPLRVHLLGRSRDEQAPSARADLGAARESRVSAEISARLRRSRRPSRLRRAGARAAVLAKRHLTEVAAAGRVISSRTT